MARETRKRESDAARIDAMEARLAALEARLGERDAKSREDRRKAIGVDVDLLERLAARGASDALVGGSVQFAGAVRVGEKRYVWHRENVASELLERVSPEALAPVLFALASPVRIRIVLSVATGARSGAELADIAEAGSTGQLYHHLGELLRAGVLAQPKRGVYELATPSFVPTLTILAAALDLRPAAPPSE